ncbi:MAG: Ion-translocating oxidoreductase complex subunit G [Sporanaerobacter sp.]|jgi:Na+-translocating ferredoxin:NAD+ oxidoreductase subunit G|uniref:RnfABCDGE type electron transport complex subunit G n=1 Tax=Sporanaerobacter sp. TaxID=2010183 RepID=UPI003A0FBB30
MNETLKLGLILLLITSISAVVLGFSNDITSVKIAEADKIANDNARKEVLPIANKFEALDENTFSDIVSSNPDVLEIYVGKDEGGNVVGYTIKTISGGFGGDIEIMTGISTEDKITGMKVLNHSETPGLGAKSTTPEFQDKFRDKSTENELVVVKGASSQAAEVEAITGATITSRAVTSGVNIAIKVYNDKLSK